MLPRVHPFVPFLLNWDRPGEIRLWGTVTWKESARLPHTGEVLSLAFSPVKAVSDAGSWDKAVKLWDLSAPRAVRFTSSAADRTMSVLGGLG